MPRFQLPHMDNRIAQALRHDLKSSGNITRIFQMLIGVVPAIGEGILINYATSATGEKQNHLWYWLIAALVAHLFLFWLSLSATTPLARFLVDFDEIQHNLDNASAQIDVYALFTETYYASVIATQISLSAIEARRLAPRNKIDFVLDETLSPWVENRTEIFRFYDGDALFNFAVYEYSEQTKKLHVVWRKHDDRLKMRNREWPLGFGHVGVCFQREKTLFSNDVSEEDSDNPVTTDVAEDKEQYKSMVSTLIWLDGVKKGVCVITSSKPSQFDKEVHTKLMEVVALLIGQVYKHCWTGSK